VKRRAREVTALLLLLAALAGVARLWHLTRHSVGVDFYQFWAVGRLLDRPGPVDVYTDAGRERHGRELWLEAQRGDSEYRKLVAGERRVLETYSTPFFYTVFALGAGEGYEWDLRLYRVVCLAALVFGLVALGRVCGHGWPATAGLVAAFTLFFEPAVSDLQVGNVNALQLGWLGLFLWLQAGPAWPGRDVAGGALLGLAAAFKPTTIFVVALVLVSRALRGRTRSALDGAAGVALGGLAAFAASALAFGNAGIWSDWLAALRKLPDTIITVEMGNFGPARLLRDLSGLDLSPVLMLALVLLAVAGIRGAFARGGGDGQRRAVLDDALAVSFGCLAMLLSLRLVWMHYFVLAAPAVTLLLGPRGAAGRIVWRRGVPFAALAVLCVQPLLVAGLVHSFAALAWCMTLATASLWVALLRSPPSG